MTKVLNIGLVGFGRMGRDHARILEQLPDVRVVSVVEPNEVNAAQAQNLLTDRGAKVFSALEEALESTDVDGWIVSSSTRTHISVSDVLLRCGAKVLLEKPIAESQASAKQLRDLVNADSSNLMMGHILLWSNEFNSIRDRVKQEGAKEISALRRRSASHRIDYPGESPFSLLMVHDLYCIQVLTSGAEPISIVGESRLHSQGGEDCAIANLEWADGSSARAESNYFVPDGEAGVGDELLVRGSGWEEKVVYGSNFDTALRNELVHFLAVIQGEASVPLGARYEDAVQIQGWVDKLKISAHLARGKGE